MSDNTPTSLNCPACGAPLEPDGTSSVVRCKFCGNVSLLPGVRPGQAATSGVNLDEIRQLITNGNLTEAIERYRQVYGVDSQEAGHAVDAIQAGRLATPSAPGMRAPEELTKALEEVQRRLAAGDKLGAIKVYREHYDVSMERAKYAIDQIEAGNPVQAETGFSALGSQPMPTAQPMQAVQAKPARKSRAGCIVGLLVLILAVVGGAIGFFALQRNGALGPHYNNNGPAELIPAVQGNTPKIAAAFYNPDKDAYFAGLIDGSTGKAVWYGSVLPASTSIDAITAGSDLVYVAAASSLLAYHQSDGSLAWQTQMPDKLNYGDSTMLVTAGRVITDNNDQSIQAYDAATGSLVWNMRLTSYDRTLRLMGGSLVVVDYTNSDHDYGLIFVDPITGDKQRTLTPTCTNNDYTSNLDPDAGIIYDQSDKALYLVYDSAYGCVQKIDLSSGKTTWEADSKDSFNFAPDGVQSLLTASNLYFVNENSLMAVEKSIGKMKVVLTNPDYNFVPFAAANGKLILRARRTRGTERFELWGVNTIAGSQVWQINLQGSSPIDPPDEMAGLIDNTGSGWTWKLASTGLVLITFQAQPNQLVVETFNPADGTSQSKKTIPLSHVSGDFYDIPSVIKWQGDLVYLSLDSGFYSLDVTTDTLKLIY